MRFGKRSFNPSGTEAGQKPDNVKNAQIIHFVREMDCITGIKTMKMY
jgi:hypothetical protein